jgi:hypothetical protein
MHFCDSSKYRFHEGYIYAELFKGYLLFSIVHGFEVRARHIVGVENRAADYLSRWHSYYKNTVNFKSCIESDNYHEVEVLEEFFMFFHDR